MSVKNSAKEFSIRLGKWIMCLRRRIETGAGAYSGAGPPYCLLRITRHVSHHALKTTLTLGQSWVKEVSRIRLCGRLRESQLQGPVSVPRNDLSRVSYTRAP